MEQQKSFSPAGFDKIVETVKQAPKEVSINRALALGAVGISVAALFAEALRAPVTQTADVGRLQRDIDVTIYRVCLAENMTNTNKPRLSPEQCKQKWEVWFNRDAR